MDSRWNTPVGAHSRPRIDHCAGNLLYFLGPGRTPFLHQYMTARSRLLR
jgi:hypothetical protein